jgi:hypothetical protein
MLSTSSAATLSTRYDVPPPFVDALSVSSAASGGGTTDAMPGDAFGAALAGLGRSDVRADSSRAGTSGSERLFTPSSELRHPSTPKMPTMMPSCAARSSPHDVLDNTTMILWAWAVT